MKKKLFTAALAFALVTPSMVLPLQAEATTSFKDISTNHPHKAKIDVLVEAGVISGFTDNTFRPSEKVNRGQFAIFISRALNLPTPTKPQSFKDVGVKSAVYDGIVKAQSAGIIHGYGDGRFKPGDLITRGDMAIMLDRALQYKASFPTRKTLSYSDKGSVGASSYQAVERLTNYNIMGAFTGSLFSPKTTGDRLETVLSIYQLMDTKKLLGTGTVTYPKGDLRNYSYAELVAEVGEWKILRRGNGDGSINEFDVVEAMHEKVATYKDGSQILTLSPKEYFDFTHIESFRNAYGFYSSTYPYFEYTAINGVPFRQTEYFTGNHGFTNPKYVPNQILANQIPNPPTEEGKFLIDLPVKNRDVVTYQKGKVNFSRMASLVKKASNNDYLVDVKTLFKDTDLVLVSTNGLMLEHNGKKLELQLNSERATLDNRSVSLSSKVVVENEVVFVPFKSVADQLGIYWRVMDLSKRFELANYPLERGILGWEE